MFAEFLKMAKKDWKLDKEEIDLFVDDKIISWKIPENFTENNIYAYRYYTHLYIHRQTLYTHMYVKYE